MIFSCKVRFILLLTSCCLLAAAEEAGLGYFPYIKQIRVPAAAVEGHMGIVFELDAEALAQINKPLRDCRVFTDSGDPVKFAVRRKEGEVRQIRLVPVEAYLAMTGENTGILKTQEALPPGAYCLELWPENPYYAKMLTIEAKLPSGRVRKVLEKAAVFSFSPPYPLVRNSVEFFVPAQAELQVSWQPGGEMPQKVLRAEDTIPESWSSDELVNVRARLFRKEVLRETAPLSARYELKHQADHANGGTIYAVDAPRVPLTGIRMETKTPFLFRQVKVYGGSGPVDLRLLAEGTFSRIAPGEPLLVTIPESRFRYYEVHMDNREKSPLDDVVFAGEGPRIELVTEPFSETLLKLAYGRQTAAGAFPRRVPEKLAVCQLGKGRRNPAFEPPAREYFPTGVYLLLGGGICAAGLLAAASLYLMRRRRREKEQV